MDNTWPNPGSPGRETNSKDGDVYDEKACKLKDDEKDYCVEECILAQWAKKRPWYQVGRGGTDCKEYTDDILSHCTEQCKNEK